MCVIPICSDNQSSWITGGWIYICEVPLQCYVVVVFFSNPTVSFFLTSAVGGGGGLCMRLAALATEVLLWGEGGLRGCCCGGEGRGACA